MYTDYQPFYLRSYHQLPVPGKGSWLQQFSTDISINCILHNNDNDNNNNNKNNNNNNNNNNNSNDNNNNIGAYKANFCPQCALHYDKKKRKLRKISSL